MQSGVIKIRNRKLPLTWSGEKAEHLAQGHIDSPHIHPLLHVAAQQFARSGKLHHRKGNRYYTLSKFNNDLVLVSLLLQPKYVLICSCYILKNTDFDTFKKQAVGRVGKKSKQRKEKIPLSSIAFPPDVEKAIVAAGDSVEDVRFVVHQYLNGYPSVNSKKR